MELAANPGYSGGS